MKTQEFIYKNGYNDGQIYSADTGKTIAIIYGSGEQSKKDGLLLASAPQLLKALKTIAMQCGEYAMREPALDYATIGNVARHAISELIELNQ